MTSPTRNEAWPALPLHEWRDSYATLHLYTQIVGKTRLALAPMENHWWQVAFYLTSRGLTTAPMPYGARTLQVDFDFVDHHLRARTSDGREGSLPLVPRSVAEFYAEYTGLLERLGVRVKIWPMPVEIADAIPFVDDRVHAAYDAEAVNRCWRVLAHSEQVLREFRGLYLGKSSPVHFFWGGFDLAVTRFSGRAAPPHPGGAPNVGTWVMREAYSHEVSSAGFWPGGGAIDFPAYYAYAYPEPPGFADALVQPGEAYYDRTMGEFILPYEAVRLAPSPRDSLMAFLQTTYEAAASLGKWNRSELERSTASGNYGGELEPETGRV